MTGPPVPMLRVLLPQILAAAFSVVTCAAIIADRDNRPEDKRDNEQDHVRVVKEHLVILYTMTA